MRKTEDGKYLLTGAELSALVKASIEQATKILQDPMYDPNDNGLPHFVNRGHILLYGKPLYMEEAEDPE